MVGDPQMQVRDGNLDGCGFRVRSVSIESLSPGNIDAIDASFNLYSKALALLKAGVLRVKAAKDGQVSAPVVRPIRTFWFKVVGEKPTSPTVGKIFPSDSPKGYLLHGDSITRVLPLFEAVFAREPLTIGVRVSGEDIDRIHTG